MSEINIEPHLVPEYTDRGIKRMPLIAGAQLLSGTPSASCARVYESSAASDPHLWLQVQEDGGRSHVHLTLENALRLADQIQFLASNHYQILAEFRDADPASRPPAEDDDHPERMCQRCGRSNVRAWTASSPLWNQVMRGGDINGEDRFDGIVCPVCFAALAEEGEIAERWRFHAERVHVELATVTPSGRVWNPETWLWDEPSRPPAAEGSGTPEVDHE